MQPLLDGDILRYECGYAAEAGWQHPGFPPWEYVQELLTNKINHICAITNATEPPILFLTGKSNFRNDIAKRQPYKTRAGKKPWHFKNLTAYMQAVYDCRIQEGLEADDLMSIEQTKRGTGTIICTRDKDLRSVSGWQFGWELGNQPQVGPLFVEGDGSIRLSNNRKSIKGEGLLFFCSQLLTGDATDSILGLERTGAVGAFKILEGSKTYLEAFNRVREAYKGLYGDFGDEYLLESGRLLWMTRELNEDGSPILWSFPSE